MPIHFFYFWNMKVSFYWLMISFFFMNLCGYAVCKEYQTRYVVYSFENGRIMSLSNKYIPRLFNIYIEEMREELEHNIY